MENLNGRKLVEEGDLCERRNGLVVCLINFKYDRWRLINLWQWWDFSSIAGRGVDLNRNWSVDWGKKEKVCLFVIFILGHIGFSFFVVPLKPMPFFFCFFFLVGFYPVVMVDILALLHFWLICITWLVECLDRGSSLDVLFFHLCWHCLSISFWKLSSV